MESSPPVVIVGAGMTGLGCALHLKAAGVPVCVLEASDRPGGRVATDEVDGFRLDRGFQVWLEAYPETRTLVDRDALSPGAFGAGSYLYDGEDLRLFADPVRHPGQLLSSLRCPAGSWRDKLRLATLRASLSRQSVDDLLSGKEMTTREAWREVGFSDEMVEAFLAPFFRGIFLAEPDQVSRRLFDFVFAMFGRGRALLPAGGIDAIPRQLAARLSDDELRVNTLVMAVDAGGVTLSTGERLAASEVVVAVDRPDRLDVGEVLSGWRSTTCVYFDAASSPLAGPWLALNRSGRGRVNQVAVPSRVAAGYAPPGRQLILVSINGIPDVNDESLAQEVVEELRGWFGPEVSSWRWLKTYRIPHALPVFAPGELPGPGVRKVRGVWVGGDGQRHPSLQGALASGRRVAEAVRAVRGV